MSETVGVRSRPWDAQLARRIVAPLARTSVRPNHLTTLRLVVGLMGVAGFLPGTYAWSNIGALLFALSNFLDHTDGELARMTGKTSRIGHVYDLASDAVIHVLLFAAIGYGLEQTGTGSWALPVGCVTGALISYIFYLRLRIEERLGKAGVRQARMAGLETEDVMYLIPVASFTASLHGLMVAAAIGSSLYSIWVTVEFLRAGRTGLEDVPQGCSPR